MTKFAKFFIGLALIPAAVAVTKTSLDLFLALPVTTTGGHHDKLWWFTGGFIFWLILWFTLPRPARTYVLAHELTHALWGNFFGGSWSKLRVTEHGGSVNLTKTNVWITLAPYFFPFYTILVILLHLLLRLFTDTTHYEPFWLALIGLTWSFHITFTLAVLTNRQPDVQEHGRLFSWTLIWILNLLGLLLWILIVTRSPILDWLGKLTGNLIHAYIGTLRSLLQLLARIF